MTYNFIVNSLENDKPNFWAIISEIIVKHPKWKW